MNLSQTLRPNKLEDVVGHKKEIAEWKKRCKEKNFPQVSFFTGPTGVGKTTLQRIIAKNILCQNTDSEGNSCNQCTTCMAIDNEKPLINYFEYDGYDLNIETIRNIEELASKKISFEKTNKKVFIIDELQALTKNPQALKKSLKFLERPYKDVYFILGAMEFLKLPAAIMNRTVRYNLKPLVPYDISVYLYKYCEASGVKIDTEEKQQVLMALGDSCNGSMRTAVSLLERVIYGDIWSKQALVSELNIISNDALNSTISGILNGEIEAMIGLELSDEIIESIRKRLNALYKWKSGINIEGYLASQLEGIDSKVTIESIETAIVKLNDLMKYNYTTPTLVEFILMSIINENKKRKMDLQKISEQLVSRPSRPVRGK